MGCIGAWVLRNLVQKGARPVAFDLASDLKHPRLLMDDRQLAQIRFVQGDIADLRRSGPSSRSIGSHNSCTLLRFRFQPVEQTRRSVRGLTWWALPACSRPRVDQR